MLETVKARIADALEIWEHDKSKYPQGVPAHGYIGFLLRLKATICILFGWEGRDDFDVIPVWIGGMFVGHNGDGPYASWTEVGVPYGWRRWHFSRYSNGV